MMIVLAWLVYCVLIAAVLTAGATAWESSARWSGRAARWGWLAALTGSATLPWLLRLVPERAWAESMPAAVTVLRLDPLLLDAAGAAEGFWSARTGALLVWLLMSATVLSYVALLLVRLVRARRRWHETELDGAAVLVTANVGPAVIGVRRAMVVVPAWVLELDAELRALLLRHERAHAAAGDPRTLLAGLMLLAAMPWNPIVWVQLLRMRNAIELDCDARVLSTGVDPARYGSLLLEVGRRRSPHALVMATFAEPRVFLEQRIRRIAAWPLERRRGRAALSATLALVLFATALSARDPLRAPVPAIAAGVEAPDVDTRDARSLLAVSDTPPGDPTFTPMTVRPELLNRADVTRALFASYPPLLRDAGIGGSPKVWFYIDTLGAVGRTLISESSGYPSLDSAALQVARVMRFSPAYNRAAKVNVWVEIPIMFSFDGVPPPARARDEPSSRTIPGIYPPLRIDGRRSGTPMTTRPELLNGAEAARALVREYPPALRDAGIDGSATLWFFIDEKGTVEQAEISESSGYPALDQAALKVARLLKFSPAERDGKAIAVWIEMPIVFTSS